MGWFILLFGVSSLQFFLFRVVFNNVGQFWETRHQSPTLKTQLVALTLISVVTGVLFGWLFLTSFQRGSLPPLLWKLFTGGTSLFCLLSVLYGIVQLLALDSRA
jgi:hypothetical protein